MKQSEKKAQARAPVDVAASGAQRAPAGPVRFQEDMALMQRVVQGHGRDQRLLAGRLVVRVRRAAHALMRGSVDANDAAQHALIEILRSARTYRGDRTVERWSDRITGVSVTRFARAVRRRNAASEMRALSESARGSDDNASAPRNLEEYLSRLPQTLRETLLLRHALGHSIEEIAEITQASHETVREVLLAAARFAQGDRARPSGAPRAQDVGLSSAEYERWLWLRDRVAIGESLGEAERDELTSFERTSAVARAYLAQIRELEGYLDTRGTRASIGDREVVERALAAVQVSTAPHRALSDDPDAELEGQVDPEGPEWMRIGAHVTTWLLALAALFALVFYEAPATRVSVRMRSVPELTVPSPTVEALASAHTAKRGGRLLRAGEVLKGEAALSAGDEVSAGERPGCLVLEPSTWVCLDAAAKVRLVDLSVKERSIEVLTGHVAASFLAGEGALTLSSSEVSATALLRQFGGPSPVPSSSFDLERSADGSAVRVGVLRGNVRVVAAETQGEASDNQVVVVRLPERTLSMEVLGEGSARGMRDLLAAGVPPSSTQSPVKESSVASSAEPPRASESASPDAGLVQLPPASEPEPSAPAAARHAAPRRLLEAAWDLLKDERWKDAAAVYQGILREHETSPEAHAALVWLGDLQLEHLAQPGAALASYDRYLRDGAGPLEPEARYGRITALARLGRKADERDAIREFLRLYPKSAKSQALRGRLRALGHGR